MTLRSFKSDVAKFNLHVKKLQTDLSARGESSPELIDHLFRAYLGASDASFVAYIQRKFDAYQEGITVTVDALMAGAKNKYHSRDELGIWNAKTPEQEKITLLEARIDEMQKQSDNPPGNGGTGNPTVNPNGPGKRRRNRRRTQTQRPPWMLKPTQPTDPTEKKSWHGNNYQWCGAATGGKCERWVVHDPKKCQGKDYRRKGQGGQSHSGETDQNPPTKRTAATGADDSDKDKRRKTEFAKALSAEIINGI